MIDWLVSLDKQLLLAVNGSSSLFLDSVVKTLTTAATWIPLYVALFFLVVKNSADWRRVALVVGCTVVCVVLAGSVDDMLVKPLAARWRPTRDPEIGILVDIYNGYRGGSFGFFSAHASNTFSIAVFFALLVRSSLLTAAMVTWSLVNCWTRLYLGVHFPGDVLVGLLWGGAVGTFAWVIFQKADKKLHASATVQFISSQYTTTGFIRQNANVVAAVLAYTLAFAIVKACLALYA